MPSYFTVKQRGLHIGLWADKDILERICVTLQEQRLIRIRIECQSLDSTSIKLYPDATCLLQAGT